LIVTRGDAHKDSCDQHSWYSQATKLCLDSMYVFIFGNIRFHVCCSVGIAPGRDSVVFQKTRKERQGLCGNYCRWYNVLQEQIMKHVPWRTPLSVWLWDVWVGLAPTLVLGWLQPTLCLVVRWLKRLEPTYHLFGWMHWVGTYDLITFPLKWWSYPLQ
jgi:hypothetical protein